METQTHPKMNNPAWWTDQHTSNWDHVKAAFERDWEQTKSDFSKNSGHKLNQELGDTMKQSAGSAPIPPMSVKTHRSDPKVAVQDAADAQLNMENESANADHAIFHAHNAIANEHLDLNKKVVDIRKDLSNQRAGNGTKLSDAEDKKIADEADVRIAAVQDMAFRRIADGHTRIAEAGERREQAVMRWQDAEREVRFGYSVRSRFPAGSEWNDKVEGDLRTDWDALDTGSSWNASKTVIHRGWDYADKNA